MDLTYTARFIKMGYALQKSARFGGQSRHWSSIRQMFSQYGMGNGYRNLMGSLKAEHIGLTAPYVGGLFLMLEMVGGTTARTAVQEWTVNEMADYIDRQVAIDALGERPLNWDDNEFDMGLVVQFDADRRMLEAVPSADVQPVRHGWWIEDKEVEFVCSECGEQCANTVMGMPRDRYCKWCGTRMDGEQNG